MKKSFISILVASILLNSGCMAIPLGANWKRGHESTIRKKIVDRVIKKSTLKVVKDGSDGQVGIRFLSDVKNKEVSEIEWTADYRKKLVVGFSPSEGSNYFSNIETPPYAPGGYVESGDLFLFNPMFWIEAVGLITLMAIATPYSWFAEIGADWTPSALDHSFSDYSMFGYAKTADSLSPPAREYRKLSSRKYVTSEVLSNKEVVFEIPDAGFKTTKTSDSYGEVSLDIGDLPIFAKNDLELEISSPDTDPEPKEMSVMLSHTMVGQAFQERLFSGQASGAKVFSDIRKMSSTNQIPAAAPHADVTMEIVPQDKSPKNKIGLKLIVTNSGRGALYQFAARTRSEEKFLDGYTFFIGRVKPGKKVEKTIYATVPQDFKTETFPLNTRFYEANNYVPDVLHSRVTVNELKRPSLAFTYKIVDDRKKGKKIVGNGDGVIQKGEAFDLLVSVKNTGQEIAKNTTLQLSMITDASVSLFSEPEMKIGHIKPGKTIEKSFNIAIRQTSDLMSIPITILTKEDSFGVQARRDINLPFGQTIKETPSPINTIYFVDAKEAIFREGASVEAAEFGRVPKGAKLSGVSELGDWIQVEIDIESEGKKKQGRFWVERKSLTLDEPQLVKLAPVMVTRFDAPPPVIVFAGPEGILLETLERSSFETTDDSLQLVISVTNSGGNLLDVRLLERSTEEKGNKRGIAIGPQRSGEKGKGRRMIRQRVDLKIGENIFTVIAKNDNGKTSENSLHIKRVEKVGKTYAISIGINNYPSPNSLSAAREDAEYFNDFAQERLGVDPTRAQILVDSQASREAIMTAFDTVAEKIKPEDSLIVLLAGHGVIEKKGVREEKYFVPQDAKWNRLFSTAIRVSDFNDILGMIAAKRVLVIADACFSSSFIKIRGANDFFSKVGGEGRIVVGYKRPAQEDRTLGHGYLTYYMVEGLRGGLADINRDGKIGIREAFDYASDKVKKKTGAPLYMQGEGDIELLRVK